MKNVSKWKKLKSLFELSIKCRNVPYLPIINVLANCKFFEELKLVTGDIPNEDIAKAINSATEMEIVSDLVSILPKTAMELVIKYIHVRYAHVYEFQRSN